MLSDLEEAIELHRAALALTPAGHFQRLASLNNLAISLQDRFQQWANLSDLDEAIKLHQAALAIYPDDHSDRSTSLNNLVTCLQDRFYLQGLSSDLDETFRLYSQLSQISHPISRNDLRSAKSWIVWAEQQKHGSALLAYQTSLKFLDQHVAVWSSSSSSDHFDVVKEASSSLAMDAFSCSVRHGALDTAVELLEQGRAVFWTQLARFRIPLDELFAAGKSLAEEFKEVSFRLRNALDASTEVQSSQLEIRRLNIQWDDVISRIRVLPDFPRFLLPPLFSTSLTFKRRQKVVQSSLSTPASTAAMH
jgi:tetratricopeptide (TPR) repeat protein